MALSYTERPIGMVVAERAVEMAGLASEVEKVAV